MICRNRVLTGQKKQPLARQPGEGGKTVGAIFESSWGTGSTCANALLVYQGLLTLHRQLRVWVLPATRSRPQREGAPEIFVQCPQTALSPLKSPLLHPERASCSEKPLALLSPFSPPFLLRPPPIYP